MGIELGYIKLSQWKDEVLDHCNSGIGEVVRLINKYPEEDGLKQILHEFCEMKDHFE